MPKPKLLSRKLLQSRPARLLDATVSAGMKFSGSRPRRQAGSIDHVCAEMIRTTACVQTVVWMPFLNELVTAEMSLSELP